MDSGREEVTAPVIPLHRRPALCASFALLAMLTGCNGNGSDAGDPVAAGRGASAEETLEPVAVDECSRAYIDKMVNFSEDTSRAEAEFDRRFRPESATMTRQGDVWLVTIPARSDIEPRLPDIKCQWDDGVLYVY